jgi:ABC-type thiamine transport system ATPase subunit
MAWSPAFSERRVLGTVQTNELLIICGPSGFGSSRYLDVIPGIKKGVTGRMFPNAKQHIKIVPMMRHIYYTHGTGKCLTLQGKIAGGHKLQLKFGRRMK